MAVNSPIKSLYAFLRSKKLALITIALLTLFSVVGMIIPQETLDAGEYQRWAQKYKTLAPAVEKLGMHQVFGSWWFLIISLLFFINLSLCTVVQIINSFKGGFKLLSWGRTIFHVGLVLVVIGGFLTTAFKTTGYMMLGEGETRQEEHQYYRTIQEGSFFREDMHKGFDITLVRQNPVFDSEGQVDYIRSLVEVKENGNVVQKHWVEKGSPLIYNNFRIFHYNAGYAPAVIIKDKIGRTVFATYLMLNVDAHGERIRHFVNRQSLPGTPYYVDFEYYPDAKVEEGKIINSSEYPNNPLAMVTIYKEKNIKIGEGMIDGDQVITFEGNTLEMGPEFKRWVGLEIVQDPGAPVLFAGCWIALLGALLYFVPGLQLKIKEA